MTQAHSYKRVVILSLLLLFFTLPHTLEDFALGAPQEAGVPPTALATVISMLFFLQTLGLYLLGKNNRKGLFIHVFLGLFWPIASGMAQLPIIFNGEAYRSGVLSKIYVFGMIIIGLLMLISALLALKKSK